MIVDDYLEQPIKDLRLAAPDDATTADFCGRLRYYEKKLADLRLTLIKETGEIEGDRYEIVDKGTWSYSFNGPGILADVMNRCDVPPWQAFRMLEDAGAAKIVFGKSAVDAFYKAHRIGMHTVSGEAVEDGSPEAPRVGRVWKQRLSAEPKKED